MKTQGIMLMKTLGLAVGMLDSMDKLVPVLQSLGRRHVSYGVTAVMYPSVAEALLITLEKGLGGECTGETKEAWGWALGVISGVCIEAAKAVDPKYGEAEAKGEGGDKIEEPKAEEGGVGGEKGGEQEERGAGAEEESKGVEGGETKVEGVSAIEGSATDGNTTDESNTDEKATKDSTATIMESAAATTKESAATSTSTSDSESAATSRESSTQDEQTGEKTTSATKEGSTEDDAIDGSTTTTATEDSPAEEVNGGGAGGGEKDAELEELKLKLKETGLAEEEKGVARESVEVALSASEKMAEME